MLTPPDHRTLVEIIDVHRRDAYYDWKDEVIGLRGRIDYIENNGDEWYGCDFYPSENSTQNYYAFYAIQFKIIE